MGLPRAESYVNYTVKNRLFKSFVSAVDDILGRLIVQLCENLCLLRLSDYKWEQNIESMYYVRC